MAWSHPWPSAVVCAHWPLAAVQQSIGGCRATCMYVCVDLLSQGFGIAIGVIVQHTYVHVVGIRREGERERGEQG